MFYRGGEDNHWTVWDPTSNTFVPRPTDSRDEAALPEWFFKATSNLMAVKIDGICSLLNQSAPAQEVSPVKDGEAARATAELCEAALPVLREEAGWPAMRARLHKLITLTNMAAVVVYYDTSEDHGMDDLPILQCASCQNYFYPHDVPEGEACPECGADGSQVDWAVDPTQGLRMSVPHPKGKLALRLLSGFETSIPKSAQSCDERLVPWIASHGRMDPNEITRLWPKARGKVEDGKSSQAAQDASTESVAYADQMRGLSAPGGQLDQNAVGGSKSQPGGPIIWMVWADPVSDETYHFPDGLYAVLLEDETLLESGPLPLLDDQERPVKNVLLRGFAPSPGSAWNKPPADDLTPLQKQLNLVQALGFLILMHEAAPVTFIPDTVTLLDELTGQPGATVPFKSLRAGDKPITVEGKGFPSSLQWFIEFLVNQFDVISKLNAVLQGARPPGDPTLGEVEILQQQGLAAFKEPLDELIRFEQRLSYLLLWTARQSAWSERFYTVGGENGEWEVKSFLATELTEHVRIEVEPMTAWPTSPLLINLRLDKALERGMLNPQDPEVQSEYLTLNDLTRFKSSTDEDLKQIGRQLDVWAQAQVPQQIGPPDPLWNLPLHFFKKAEFLKTEEAEAIAQSNMPVYQAMRQHVLMIQQMLQQAAMAQAAIQKGPQPQKEAKPQPKPGEKGGPRPDGQAMNHAVKSGALRPAAGPKKPDGAALSHAIATKALRPAPPIVGGRKQARATKESPAVTH